MVRMLFVAITIATASSLSLAQQPAPTDSPARSSPADDQRQQQREADFAKRLTGATLHGFFTTTDGTTSDEPPELRGDRYDLLKVEKRAGGLWLLQSRIRYGDHDVTIPLNLPVEWAGETPVIVVDDLAIPGMGTFTARVMFHKDHYAGYWSGGDHGGHLFGRIVRQDGDQQDGHQTPEEKSAQGSSPSD